MTLTTVIQTIDDLDVSPGSGYSAVFIYSFHQPGSSVTMIERFEGPEVTAVTPGLHRLSPISIQIADYSNAEALQVELFRALDTSEEAKALVISDPDGDNRRYVMFVTESLQQLPDTGGLGYIATLLVAEQVRWRSDEEVVEALNWTSSSTTIDLTVEGHLPAYPTYTFTPRAPKSTLGWPHMMQVAIQWRSPLQVYLPLPLDLTGGGWNTAALVTAGKLSNRNNIGVLNEAGRFVPFWYGGSDNAYTGFNNASTKIWVNHPVAARVAITNKNFISSLDNSSLLEFDAYPSETRSLPTTGWLRFETGEIISYSGYLANTHTLLNVVRGVGGTTPVDHQAGELLEKLAIYTIVYGPNSVVAARYKDADYQAGLLREPLINKTYSTNSSWRQELFRSGARTAAWAFGGYRPSMAFTQATDESGIAGSFVEPWTALGFRHDVAGVAAFAAYYAIPLKTVRILGARHAWGYEIDYPGSPDLVVTSPNGRDKATLWNAAAGGVFDDFDDTMNTPTVADIANDDLEEWQWRLFHSLRFEVTTTNHVQTDIQRADVTFVDNYTPIVTRVSSDVDYDMDMAFVNNTTGEAMYVHVPNIALNKSVIINTADSTVVYSGDNSNRYAALTTNTPRPFFMRLPPGLNQLLLIDNNLTDLDVEVRYTPRYYK